MALTISQVSDFLNKFFQPFFNKIVVALLILLVGFIIGRIIGKVIQKLLHEIELNRILKGILGIQIYLEQIISTVISYSIYLIAIVMTLDKIGLRTYVINILSFIIIILIAFSIFLSIKDFLPNFIAGLIIQRRRQIVVGDNIRFRNISGKIIDINLIETKVETRQGDIIFIPHSLMTKENLIKEKNLKFG